MFFPLGFLRILPGCQVKLNTRFEFPRKLDLSQFAPDGGWEGMSCTVSHRTHYILEKTFQKKDKNTFQYPDEVHRFCLILFGCRMLPAEASTICLPWWSTTATWIVGAFTRRLFKSVVQGCAMWSLFFWGWRNNVWDLPYQLPFARPRFCEWFLVYFLGLFSGCICWVYFLDKDHKTSRGPCFLFSCQALLCSHPARSGKGLALLAICFVFQVDEEGCNQHLLGILDDVWYIWVYIYIYIYMYGCNRCRCTKIYCKWDILVFFILKFWTTCICLCLVYVHRTQKPLVSLGCLRHRDFE